MPDQKPTVPLDALRAVSLKQQVISQLTRLIEDGVLKAGERLPSERELAEQLNVARGTVREAVQFLHALGMVEIRHGSGTYVRVSGEGMPGLAEEWRSWTAHHADEVQNLLEVRKGLESFAAELAAIRITDEGLEEIDQALSDIAAAMDARDVAALIQSDVRFHQALCAASGNKALIDLADTLGERLLHERGATFSLPGRPERSLEEHREIFEAVKAHDALRARAAVLAHLSSIESDIVVELTRKPEEK